MLSYTSGMERIPTPGANKDKKSITSAIGGALAVFGLGTMAHEAPQPANYSVERVAKQQSAADALWALYEHADERTRGRESIAVLDRARQAALDQFFLEHPGLREEIVNTYGAEPVVGDGDIHVIARQDGGEPSVKGITFFGVYDQRDNHQVRLFEVGIEVIDGRTQLVVMRPADSLSHFFPGVETLSAEPTTINHVSTTGVVEQQISGVNSEGVTRITSTVRFPDGKTGTYYEDFAPTFQGTPTGDYAIGDTIPFVEYLEQEDGTRVIENRTYPRG